MSAIAGIADSMFSLRVFPLLTRQLHHRGLPVSYSTSTIPPEVLGDSMKRHASIGVALLVLSHLAFAKVSSALAQAGSTGGTIGKQDKSISGGNGSEQPHSRDRPE